MPCGDVLVPWPRTVLNGDCHSHRVRAPSPSIVLSSLPRDPRKQQIVPTSLHGQAKAQGGARRAEDDHSAGSCIVTAKLPTLIISAGASSGLYARD